MAQIQSYIDTLKSQGHTPGSPGYYKAFQEQWYKEGKPTVYYPHGASRDEGGVYEATVQFWDYYTPAASQSREAARIQKEEYYIGREAEQRRAQGEYGGTRTNVALTDVGGRTPIVTKEQLEAKAAYVQSPTAQYASESAFQQAAGSVQQYRNVEAKGVIPSVISQERIPEPQQKPLLTLGGAIARVSPGQFKDPYTGQDTRDTGTRNLGKIPLFDPVSGKPNIIFTTPAVQSEIKRDPKYGFMVRQDIAERQQAVRREELLRSSVPGSVTLSAASTRARRAGEQAGNWIRNRKVDTSFLPQEIKESPGFKGGEYLFGLGRESTAGVIEFGGIVPGTVELIGKTAIKQPSKLPKMVVVGGLEFVGSTARQAKENPAQLVSDLVVTAGVFKGIGLGARGIGTGARIVKTTAPKAVTFFAEGFKPVPKVDTTGMTLGQKMFGRPITKELKSLTEVTPFKRSPRETLKSWTEVTRYEKSPREVIKSVTEMTPFKKSPRDVLKSWTEVTPFEKSPRDVLKSWTEVTPFEKSPRDVLKSSTIITPFKKSPRKVVKSFLEVKPYGGKTKAISEPIIRRVDAGAAGVFKGMGRGAKAVKTTAPKLGISKEGFKRFVESESAELLLKKKRKSTQKLKLLFKEKSKAETKPVEVIDLRQLDRYVTEQKPKEVIDLSRALRVQQKQPTRQMGTIDATPVKKIQSDIVQARPFPQKQKVFTVGELLGYSPSKIKSVETAAEYRARIKAISSSKATEKPVTVSVNALDFGVVAISKPITKTVSVAISKSRLIARAIPISQAVSIQKQKAIAKTIPVSVAISAYRQKQNQDAVVINTAKQQQKQRQKQLSITIPTQKESDKTKFGFGLGLRTPSPPKPTGETSIVFKIPEIKVPRTPKNPPRDTPRIRPPRTQPPRNPPPRTPTIRKPPKPKKSQNTFGFKKPKKGRSKSSKFLEITPVTLPSAMLGTLRTRAKAKPKAKPRKQTRKQKPNRRKHNK